MGAIAMKTEGNPVPNRSHRTLIVVVGLIWMASSGAAYGQRLVSSRADDESAFGPVMRAYLGYLRNEQEVVDDRISRREITAGYYHRNSNRIRALRLMAVRLVRTTGNDYVPELEAVAPDELKTLFENPPRAGSFKPDQVLNNKFRFLGVIQANEPFYVFARLDPYEQAELMQKERSSSRPVTGEGDISTPNGQPVGQTAGRPKRTIPH